MLKLILIFASLVIAAWLVARYAGLPKNITLLFVAQPLVMSAAPLMVFLAGIISTQLTADSSLVTLPLGMMVAGVASATVPAAFLAKKWGRRQAVMLGFGCSVLGNLMACYAIVELNFIAFNLAAFLMGCAGAFGQQLRFAAMESLANKEKIPRAISVLMFTGIFAAFIGPEVGLLSRGWLNGLGDEVGYAGAFLVLATMSLVSILIISRFQNPVAVLNALGHQERSLTSIIKQPVFVIAVMAAALGFGLMSFVMTATPLSMHNLHGHSLEHTKWVIQSHVAAMYLPSLLTIWLGQKIPVRYFLLAGTLMYVAVLLIASLGHQLMHYWWALIALGVGWNFLFYTGTTLLPRSYQAAEKYKVQAVNDFSVFTFQGASSLLAGWVVFQYGWQGIVNSSLPFVVVLLLMTAYVQFKHKCL